jgi:hypothetical protein
MSADRTDPAPRLWSRRSREVEGPNRSFGGYYRSSDREVSGKIFRGIPLQTAEDTAVAAVRMGYRVVDAQIDRALDMARRLRGAATKAGVKDSNDILDQAERLLSRGGLAALEFLESAANRPENPLMRLLVAEYRLLGSLFGLQTEPAKTPDRDRPKPPSDGPAPGDDARPAAAPSRWRVRIKHLQVATERRRAVNIARFDMSVSPPAATSYDSFFHHTSQADADPIEATLKRASHGEWVLEIQTERQPSGRWRAAVCNEKGEQVGIIEIDL